METKEKRGFFGSDLKIIAIVAMFIDHFGAVLVEKIFLRMLPPEFYAFTAQEQTVWFTQNRTAAIVSCLYNVLRAIGRFGFPIFAFLLVEGFLHTRDAKKYALRLGLFALISEIPFDLAFANVFFYEHYQNVFFTLTIAMVALIFIKYFEDKNTEGCMPLCTVLGIAGMIVSGAMLYKHCILSGIISGLIPVKAFAFVFPIFVGVLTAFLILAITNRMDTARKNSLSMTMFILAIAIVLADGLMTDYGGWGVFTVVIMYLLRKKRVLAFSMGLLGLTVMSPIEAFAFIMLPFVSRYNGKRGISLKYFFYAFYPVHLGLLYLAAYLGGYAYFYWH